MLFPIMPPPGVVRHGTTYEAGGQVSGLGAVPPRWTDASLVRWYGPHLGPIRGWQARTIHAVTGAARTILPWGTNANPPLRYIAIGTHSKLYVQDVNGSVFDITPALFVAGQADESVNTGFGIGTFGTGSFGTPRPDVGASVPALVWDLDTWGDNLVGCAFSDGRLVQWALSTATPAAAISGAPTGCLGTFVTEQGFQFAIAPSGDGRRLQWSDQGVNTTWTPSASNQAGQIDLVTFGAIKKGLRAGQVALILTDQDVHVGQYVGLPLVYSFQRVGSGCGAISKGCAVAMGEQAAWWATSGFWIYDGGARPIECEIYDDLIRNLNQGQKSKITGFHNSQFGEVWWFFPSAGSTENDSYVSWDYRRNHWNIGVLARLCASEGSVFKYPLAMDGNGVCFEHEVGFNYDGALPFAKTGPIEFGGGDEVMHCLGIIPDEASAGQVTVGFSVGDYPDAPQVDLGQTTLNGSGRSDLRFTTRQAAMRVTAAAAADWRFGKARLDLQPGGRR